MPCPLRFCICGLCRVGGAGYTRLNIGINYVWQPCDKWLSSIGFMWIPLSLHLFSCCNNFKVYHISLLFLFHLFHLLLFPFLLPPPQTVFDPMFHWVILEYLIEVERKVKKVKKERNVKKVKKVKKERNVKKVKKVFVFHFNCYWYSTWNSIQSVWLLYAWLFYSELQLLLEKKLIELLPSNV